MEMPQDTGLMSDMQEMSTLTYRQRFLGFFATLGMGIFFIAISFFFAPMVALFPKKFAFFLTVGNLFSLGSTTFLVGFKRQMRLLFDAKRFEAGLVYVASLILTLVAALHWKSSALAIIFAVMQVCSVLWYALSYVPFARRVFGLTLSYAWAVLWPILSLVGEALRQCYSFLFSATQ